MEYTGERFVPGCDVQSTYEHVHRYMFASRLTADKAVLDLASGEGYGTFFLSKSAGQVIGMDIDAEAVKSASEKYKSDNLRFIQGDCALICDQISGNSLDAVVFFEGIEHVDQTRQEAALAGIKKCLKNDGLLIVSTPNKPLYRKIADEDNKYHIREMTLQEFTGLLGRYFSSVRLFGERFETASIIWPLYEPVEGARWSSLHGTDAHEGLSPEHSAALYYIAVCSDGAAALEAGTSLLVDEGLGEMTEFTEKMNQQTLRINYLEKRLAEVLASNSWKVTAPLRKLTGIIK